MKNKIQLKKSLTLNKESIVKLQESQMANVKGGVTSCLEVSCVKSCSEDSCHPTGPVKPPAV